MEVHFFPQGCFFSSLQDISGKKVTVMGLGLNGGGEATVRFFLNHGATVTVTDMKNQEQLSATIEALKPEIKKYGDRLRFVLGYHEVADFSLADVVIKNPGVKIQGNKYLATAKHIETDLSVFLNFTKAPIIAVTGSKGKSSTVSAIHYGLTQAGFKTFLGGNITVSPLTFLDQTDEKTPVILELSSWQLADLRGRGVLKPNIALLTTIVPDHQNWYGDMESYIADKKLIYADQTEENYTICQGEGPWGKVFAQETRAKTLYCGNVSSIAQFNGAFIASNGKGYIRLPGMKTPELVLDKLQVPGSHMKSNALNAALVMYLMKVPADQICQILSTWNGIPHRLEYFHSWKNNNATIRFYNDSASTVPEATVAATKAFDQPIHLICGGTDKELDFEPLAKSLTENPPLSINLLAGTGTDKLLALLNSDLKSFDSFELLLNNLKSKLPQKDGIVVFSPGATSFGMFKNEFHRGEIFKTLVKKVFS